MADKYGAVEVGSYEPSDVVHVRYLPPDHSNYDSCHVSIESIQEHSGGKIKIPTLN